jgi:hypothetical protein
MLKASSGCSCPGKLPDNFTMGFPTIITEPGKLFPASEGAWSPRSNPLSLALSAALYHILSYKPSCLTAQFVLMLTAQGLAER